MYILVRASPRHARTDLITTLPWRVPERVAGPNQVATYIIIEALYQNTPGAAAPNHGGATLGLKYDHDGISMASRADAADFTPASF